MATTEQLERVNLGAGALRKLEQLARERGISVDEAASMVLERFFERRLPHGVAPARRKS